MTPEKQEKIKRYIMKGLFVLFALMLIWNYYHFKQEFVANQDIFSFKMRNVDNIIDDNNKVNLTQSVDVVEDLQLRYGIVQEQEQKELDPNRCIYFYALLQRWYNKYLSPLLIMLGVMLIVKVLFTYIDFNMFKKGDNGEAEL